MRIENDEEVSLMLRRLIIGVVLVGAAMASAGAESTDLEWGVFIAHYVPELGFSSDPPPEGWCEAYWSYPLGSCEDQNNRIDVTGWLPCSWYVLAAWEEEKEWCGGEFGFGNYDARVFAFGEYGACYPEAGLENSTGNWPGPNEGTIFLVSGSPWAGNFLPIYYFGGYAYSDFGPEVITLDVNPTTGSAGTRNCLQPPESWEAIELGGLGINADGILVCPEGPRAVCCDTLTYDCYILSQGDCEAIGGRWLPMWSGGCPVPCEPHVCCVGPDCYLVPWIQCHEMYGVWDSLLDSCEPNPCGSPSPTQGATWGGIKSHYR